MRIPPERWLLIGILALAAFLRFCGLLLGPPIDHPDEYSFVLWPLCFFGGDLNPHFFTYPTLHYYFLGLLYGIGYVWQWLFGDGWSPSEFAAYFALWEPETPLLIARWTGAFLSLCTVAWTALAGRYFGRTASLLAALLMALSSLHVRQSPLTCVDIPMALWFTGAVWAALRLLQREGARDYALAGLFVGMAAASKYPGAAAGAAVLAAHLATRRGLFDHRLWLAGSAALLTFCTLSPYVLLDFSSFRAEFLSAVSHVRTGRGEGGWWYHLWISLRYNLGWPGWIAMLAAICIHIQQRRRECWVVLAAFAAFYITISWGQLAFIRYALPLLVLQALLVADLLSRIEHPRLRTALVTLVAGAALYPSLRIVALQSTPDSRAQARSWIEANVPPGTTCCNFGGWAGDVHERTFSDLGLRLRYLGRAFGVKELANLQSFLENTYPGAPFYRYAVQGGNQDRAAGDVVLMAEEECGFAILHRHVLPYSRIDSTFASVLSQRAKLVATFMPAQSSITSARYDISDAYYLPIGDFGALWQAGPQVEIWQLNKPSFTLQSPRRILARAYGEWAGLESSDGHTERALNLFNYAQHLHAGAADLRILAVIYAELGREEGAIALWREAATTWTSDSRIPYNMGVAHARREEYESAISHFERALSIDPENNGARFALAGSLVLYGRGQEALPHLRRLAAVGSHAEAQRLLNLLSDSKKGE